MGKFKVKIWCVKHKVFHTLLSRLKCKYSRKASVYMLRGNKNDKPTLIN